MQEKLDADSENTHHLKRWNQWPLWSESESWKRWMVDRNLLTKGRTSQCSNLMRLSQVSPLSTVPVISEEMWQKNTTKTELIINLHSQSNVRVNLIFIIYFSEREGTHTICLTVKAAELEKTNKFPKSNFQQRAMSGFSWLYDLPEHDNKKICVVEGTQVIKWNSNSYVAVLNIYIVYLFLKF